MIKPDIGSSLAVKIVVEISDLGFQVVEMREETLSRSRAWEFYKEHQEVWLNGPRQ